MDPNMPPPSAQYLAATRQPNIIACASILIAIPALAVLGRLWSRAIVGRGASFWWDDWMLLTSLVFSTAFLSINIWWTTVGLGKHAEAIPPNRIITNTHAEIASVTVYAVVITFLKLAALTFYARLFKISKPFRYQLWVVGTVVSVWGIILIILPFVNCTPVRKYVDPLIPGTCLNVLPEYEAIFLINFFLDFIVLVLPLPVIWKLQMSLSRKLQTTIVFVFGYASAFLSLARAIIIFQDPGLISNSADSDLSWNFVPLLYISMLEAPMGILALCAPSIHQLFRHAQSYGLSAIFGRSVTRPYAASGASRGRRGSPLSPSKGNSGHGASPHGISHDSSRGYHNFDMPSDEPSGFSRMLTKLHMHSVTSTAEGSRGGNSDEEAAGGTNRDIPLDSIYVKRDVTIEQS